MKFAQFFSRMKIVTGSIIFLYTSIVSATAETVREGTSTANLSKSGVAIEGYDPVSYFDNRPGKGSKKFIYEFEGAVFRFIDQANMARFAGNPEAFIPKYGGWCAWAMYADGSKVSIDPKSYLIIDDELYLFYDTFLADTRALWEKETQKRGIHAVVRKADKSWASNLNK